MSEEVVPKYLSASTGVLLFVAILPAFVLLGVYFHERILTKRWKWSAKKILTVDLILVLVMPAYGKSQRLHNRSIWLCIPLIIVFFLCFSV